MDFLVKRYGREKLRQVLGPIDIPFSIPMENLRNFTLVVDPGAPVPAPPPVLSPPPPFQGVYGLSLDELEKAWWEELAGAQ